MTDGESFYLPWQCCNWRGNLFLTENGKPTGKIFPDGLYRQGLFTDGFPSGKDDFPWQFSPDGSSLTDTVTDGLPWRVLTLSLTEFAVTKKVAWGSADCDELASLWRFFAMSRDWSNATISGVCVMDAIVREHGEKQNPFGTNRPTVQPTGVNFLWH